MIDLPTTQYEIVLTKTVHDEVLKKFQAYTLIQCALVQQIFKCIEDKNLTVFRKRVMGQVPAKIRALGLYLFRIYGKISS